MKTFKNATEQKFAQLVDELEAKFVTGKWVMPFKAACPHFNMQSNKRYNGINAWLLSMVAIDKGFQSKAWMTFKQAQAKTWRVKKGESGTPVQFWSPIKDKLDPEKEVWFVKYYTVFNLDQIADADGNSIKSEVGSIEIGDLDSDLPTFDEQRLLLEKLSAGLNVTVHHHQGLGSAFYRPSEHAVYLPTVPEFHTMEGYLATYCHELAHSVHRFVRPDWKKGNFGSVLYAREECVAELTAVFVSSMLGIEKIALDSHAGYISGWLKTAKDDDAKFFTKAIKEATKAAFYMWDILYPVQSSDSSDVESPETIEV